MKWGRARSNEDSGEVEDEPGDETSSRGVSRESKIGRRGNENSKEDGSIEEAEEEEEGGKGEDERE
jgi:hypothetical protein